MKLSIQENLLPGDNITEKIKNAVRYGIEGIELWDIEIEEKIKKIKKLQCEVPIKVSTICSENISYILSDRKEERDKAIDRIKNLLEIAADVKAVGVVLVPIFGKPKLPDLSPWMNAYNLEIQLLVDLLGEIAEKAVNAGSICLLEPLNRYETHFMNSADQAISICQKINSPGIKIMLDFFHMNIEEKNIDETIKKSRDFLAHVHLADSNRLLPGQGHINFRSAFKSLKEIAYNKYLALECTIGESPEKEIPLCVQYLKNNISVK